MSEQELIDARKRLDDASRTLQMIAMSNQPTTKEGMDNASEQKARADLEYERAYLAYHGLLKQMAAAPL